MIEMWNLSVPIVKAALVDPKYPKKYKVQLAARMVEKMIPQQKEDASPSPVTQLFQVFNYGDTNTEGIFERLSSRLTAGRAPSAPA